MYDQQHQSSDEESDEDGWSARARRRISIMTNEYYNAPSKPKLTGRRFFVGGVDSGAKTDSEEDSSAMPLDEDEKLESDDDASDEELTLS